MAQRIACLVLLLCCGLPARGAAQSAAVLFGTVVDESQAALPGATVTATDAASGRQYVATSDERGAYRLSAILPGTYRVQAELSGFATVVHTRVELLVGQQAELPIVLKVAAFEETLTVTEQSLLNRRSAVVGGNIDRRQMQELPILGRNWMELSLLAKGVAQNSVVGNRPGADRDDQFQLNLDGQQITQNIGGSGAFGQPALSREAIAEYQVSTSLYDVTQGRSVGLQVQAISRAGTNDVRGSAYANVRDDRFNAKDFVARRVLPYANTQAGASLGGPIVQNVLHYFAVYEYEREPNTAIVNPQLYSTAPISSVSFPTKAVQHNVLARVDHQPTARDHITARGTFWHYGRPFGNIGAYPTSAEQTVRHNTSVTANWSKVLSNDAVQEIRAGYSRYYLENRLGDGVPVTPAYAFPGLSVGGTFFLPQDFYQQVPSVRYDLTLHRGGHDFRIGGEYLHRRDGGLWERNARGTFAFEGSIPDLARRFPLDAWNDPGRWDFRGLSDFATSFTQFYSNDFTTDIPRRTWALWAGDTWAISDRLTMNYGVRWDVDWGIFDYPGFEDVSVPLDNGKDRADFGYRTGLRDLTNVAPRVGATFKVNEKLLLRGGAGLFYGLQESNLGLTIQLQAINERRVIGLTTFNNPKRADFLTNPTNGVTREDVLSGRVPVRYPLLVLDPDYKNPKTFQTTAGFQAQLGDALGFDADLTYARGMNLGFQRDVNVPYDPATGYPLNINFPTPNAIARPRPDYDAITVYQSTAKSEQAAIASSLTRRLRDRWQLGVTHTLMLFMRDEGTGGFGYLATFNNPFCQACEWATSTAFQRHTLRLNGIWQAPWGLTVAGIYAFGSGTRFNPTYSTFGQPPSRLLLAAGAFGVNRFVSGTPVTIPERVTYPDGSVHDLRSRFAGAAAYATGSEIPRNALKGDAFSKLDLRLSKTVAVPATRVKLTGTVEVFNLFNHANYAAYNTAVNLANFGRPSAALQPRTVQLACRAEF